MPKVNIQTADERDFDLAVGWTKDQYVQIGILSPGDEKTIVIDGVEFEGIYCSPNRAEINRLIKALRQARDSAFGKDE